MLENLSFKNEDTTIFTKPLFDWLVLIMKDSVIFGQWGIFTIK